MPWRRRWEWVSASMSRFRASFGFETGGNLSFVFEKLDCLLGSVSSLSFPCFKDRDRDINHILQGLGGFFVFARCAAEEGPAGGAGLGTALRL